MHLSLKANGIHIWRQDIALLPTLNKEAYSLLTPAELTRSEAISLPALKQNYLKAHYFLHSVLNLYQETSAKPLEISYHDHGKPYLKNNCLQFNLAHSGQFLVLALSLKVPIGIDIERRKKRPILSLAKRYYHPEEFLFLHSLPAKQQLVSFYDLWVCKEALVKASGLGLFSINIITTIFGFGLLGRLIFIAVGVGAGYLCYLLYLLKIKKSSPV